jgi:hypothetical protein
MIADKVGRAVETAGLDPITVSIKFAASSDLRLAVPGAQQLNK